MNQNDRISARQFTALGFVAILPPLIRRFPRALAETAGRTAWLSVPMAALPLALAALLYCLLFRGKSAGTGFTKLLADALGAFLGKLVTGLYALWFLLYAGFLLRSGANRFITAVYPGAAPWIFIVATALLCALAAAGPLKALGRTATLFRPILAVIPLLILLLAVKDADFTLLLPVTKADLAPNALAALENANLFGVAAYLAFCADRVNGPLRPRDWAGWAAALLAVLAMITVGCLAMFGPELTAEMTHPFFLLARDVTVLGALERIEPVAVAIWVLADFVLIAALLWMAAGNFCFCFTKSKPKPWWLPVLCAALAATGACLAPPDTETLAYLSDVAVPMLSAVMAFGVPLIVLIVGKIRNTI